MASGTESTLLSKLESSTSTSTPIFALFCDHLRPLADFRNSKSPDQTLTRSVAKPFLPFLNRSISILRSRLSDPPRLLSQGAGEHGALEFALELFDTYRLCLDCLELMSSHLDCKPFKVYAQRLNLAYCLEAWDLYREARNEGFGLLERVRGLDLGRTWGEFLPGIGEDVDTELARFVVDVVNVVVKSVAIGRSKDGEDYRRVIGLVKEAKSWFRCVLKSVMNYYYYFGVCGK